jgi:hypothetical protein
VYKVTVRSGAEVTVTRGKDLLKRIGNKIVHATVDDFSVGDYPMAATLQPDVPDAGPDRLGQPTKAVFMSEAAKAIDFTTTVDVHCSAANRTVKPATDTAQLVRALLHTAKLCAGYTQSVLPKDRKPQWWLRPGIPSRCRSNGPTPHGELQRRQERGEQHASGEGCVYPIILAVRTHPREDAHGTLSWASSVRTGRINAQSAGLQVVRAPKTDKSDSHVAVIISNNVPEYRPTSSD